MSTSYLLDSSVLILLLGEDKKTRNRLEAATGLYMSSVALGELFYGAYHSAYVERNIIEILVLTEDVTVLALDNQTARIYGRLRHEQGIKGLMLPSNDLWIAATAIQHGLTLAARDRHFMWLAGLDLEQW